MPVRIEGAIDIGGNIFITSELQVSGASSFNRVAGDRVYVWTGSGSIVLPMSGTVDYLIAAGGGAGARNANSDNYAGGGGGGLIIGSFVAQPSQLYTITTGAGAVMTYDQRDATGGNSSISGGSVNLVALGGGSASSKVSRGQGSHTSPQSAGGSGAGNTGGEPGPGSPGLQPGSASGGYGNAGGLGYAAGLYQYFNPIGGGGGGGAGTAGTNATRPSTFNVTGGNGGDGISSDITGTSIYYCGGGFGAGSTNNGTNGLGGGPGSYGGGGGKDQNGGPGIVILRFGFM